MKDELNQYLKEPGAFWKSLPMRGVDGYDTIELADQRGWKAIPHWGKDGYNLGSWPLVIIFFRDRKEYFDVIEYVEGDVTMWSCPTKELRQEITDGLAFFHWKHQDEHWVKDYTSVDQLPDDLRGPYRPG